MFRHAPPTYASLPTEGRSGLQKKAVYSHPIMTRRRIFSISIKPSVFKVLLITVKSAKKWVIMFSDNQISLQAHSHNQNPVQQHI